MNGHKLNKIGNISPGYIQDPIDGKEINTEILNRIVLGRKGEIANTYQTVKYLIDNDYITGQIIRVNGGRSLHM